jgi:fumarylacetoacetase
MLNETHEKSRRSWVESANDPRTDFPLQNLPFGVFRHGEHPRRCGIAIGDYVFSPSLHPDLFDGAGRVAAEACSQPDLNDLMSLGPHAWSDLRRQVFRMLAADDPRRPQIEPTLLPREAVTLLLPARIGNFTDFFSSMFHARNAGRLFRPDNPLFPNYKYVPVAYHGRASSIRASGAPVKRPRGQVVERGGPAIPAYKPTAQLDFEAELGMLIGTSTQLGEPVPIAEARRHIFGMCIVNDWSARDIQAWESQPLGPFLSKSFGTTISPWVVTMEALEPFRIPVFARAADDPAPLPHLRDDEDQASGSVSIMIETRILTPKMVADGAAAARIGAGRLADGYWSPAQMIAHHTSNGCNLESGDLIATGTISGDEPESWGCLLEKTAGGRNEIDLGNGERRTYLLDGDEIILSARCENSGYRSIGFGECRGVVVA